MVLHIVEHGAAKLAVPLGAAGRGHAVARLSGLRASPGWHVDGGAVREWRFEGIASRADGASLYGPDVGGVTLEEALARPLPEAVPFLARLADALGTLAERAVPPFPLQSDAVILDDRGGVLFLPPEAMREIRGVRPFAENRDAYEALNHPDLRDEALASFSLGVCLYRAAVGAFPFTGRDEEELHERARKLALEPPDRLVPDLRPDAASLVMAALGRVRGRGARIEDWRAGFAAWTREGITRRVDPAERERLAREATARSAGAAKRFAVRTFWEKNWKIAAISAAGAGLAVAVIVSILSGVFAPRATRGYPPRRVVETFYGAINSMDHSLMEDCVVDRAGQGEVNEAMNLYVLSRVQMGYEGKANTVPADQWDAAGRPVLPAGTAVYGVTGLAVVEQAGEPAPVYLASYEKWSPASANDAPIGDTTIATEHRRIVDRVSLRRDKGDWVIFRIDRQAEETLPSPPVAPPAPVDPDAEPKPNVRF